MDSSHPGDSGMKNNQITKTIHGTNPVNAKVLHVMEVPVTKASDTAAVITISCLTCVSIWPILTHDPFGSNDSLALADTRHLFSNSIVYKEKQQVNIIDAHMGIAEMTLVMMTWQDSCRKTFKTLYETDSITTKFQKENDETNNYVVKTNLCYLYEDLKCELSSEYHI